MRSYEFFSFESLGLKHIYIYIARLLLFEVELDKSFIHFWNPHLDGYLSVRRGILKLAALRRA